MNGFRVAQNHLLRHCVQSIAVTLFVFGILLAISTFREASLDAAIGSAGCLTIAAFLFLVDLIIRTSGNQK